MVDTEEVENVAVRTECTQYTYGRRVCFCREIVELSGRMLLLGCVRECAGLFYTLYLLNLEQINHKVLYRGDFGFTDCG